MFLFLISCSEFSQSNLLNLHLQTGISSRGLNEFFGSEELSLRDPVDLGVLLKILSPFFKSHQKADFALRSYTHSS
jgi:hypothetical protein